MNEYELQDIWKNNLREFNDVMRLDSIIIRAMQEAVKEAQSKQCNIADVRLSLLDKVKEIAFGDGSAQEKMVDIKALFSNEA